MYLRPGWTPETARENTIFLSTHLVDGEQSLDNGWSPSVVEERARAIEDQSKSLDGRGLLVIRHGRSLHNYVSEACGAILPAGYKSNLHHMVPDPPLYDARKPQIHSAQVLTAALSASLLISMSP